METLATLKVSIVLLPNMETQDRILQKSYELYSRYGIRSITMDEIASQLGISKKTIYQYYADKHDLVDAVGKFHIEQNMHRCVVDKTLAENAIHEIFLSMDMVQEMMADMSPTIFYDLQKYHSKTFARFNDHRNEFIYGVLKENLDWGIKEGLYRPEINVDIITKTRLEAIFLPFNQDIFPQNKYTLLQLQKETMLHFLYGVATTEAHSIILKYKQQRLKNTINE